jgi:CBS domain-containing protein
MGKTARDIMSTDVKAISEDATTREAAEQMKELDVGALPICGSDDRLKGLITDRDIVVGVVAEGKDPAETKVSELATGDSSTVTIGADDSLEQTLETMKRHQVRRLPVIDGKEMVGIIAQADVAKAVKEDRTGETVEAISQ